MLFSFCWSWIRNKLKTLVDKEYMKKNARDIRLIIRKLVLYPSCFTKSPPSMGPRISPILEKNKVNDETVSTNSLDFGILYSLLQVFSILAIIGTA